MATDMFLCSSPDPIMLRVIRHTPRPQNATGSDHAEQSKHGRSCKRGNTLEHGRITIRLPWVLIFQMYACATAFCDAQRARVSILCKREQLQLRARVSAKLIQDHKRPETPTTVEPWPATREERFFTTQGRVHTPDERVQLIGSTLSMCHR